ncbi:MAG: CotH kinase family protein [Bacteroidales bacterium]|nr:CotH kinase family protein [Bacteroidales bacterium]
MKKYNFKIVLLFLNLSYSLSLYSTTHTLTLTFSSHRGFYNDAFVLFIESSDPTATIKYSTDCSDPLSATGNIYITGLVIDSTMIVKAIAFSATDTSELITHTYLFPDKIKLQPNNPNGFPDNWGGSSIIPADYEMDPNVINNPEYSASIDDAIKSLPSLCLSMAIDEWFNYDSGLYVGYPNSSISREKPVSAEFIYTDSAKSFFVSCGVQNQGGTSIVNWKVPKQSMRLLFKEQYGPKKLKKKIFPDSDIESINTLVVDGFLYSWLHPWDNTQRVTALYFRDQLASNMQNNMGGLSFHGVYVNLYINGLYWGVYDLHERPDEDFVAEYYDAQPEDFDIIKHNPNTIVAGSNSSYLNLLAEARKGFSTPESLESIKGYLDLPSFIDYMILNFYLGNFDWAHQNYYAAVNTVLNTGYRFYTWDAEHVMRYSDVYYNNTNKNDIGGPTEIHQLLKENPEYRLMFADAFYRHTFNNGALTPENFEKAFLKLKNEIDLAIILESARWGDYLESSTGVTYTKNDYWVPEANKVLSNYIPDRLQIVIEQLRQSDNLLFPEVMPPVFDKEQGKITKGEGVSLTSINTDAGDIIYTLDGTDPRKTGGGVQGLYYNSPITINKATLIKARFISSGDNEWSALTAGYYIPDSDYNAVMISEIMYNSGYYGMEFIELFNNGASDVNLIGYSFIDGIEYSFTQNVILKPGNRLVLANDTLIFKSVYQFSPYDIYTKNLSNGGETILLANYIGEIIDSVTYSDTIPWPLEADGYGRSLELIDPDSDNADAINWRSSEKLFGSPQEYDTNTSVPFNNIGGIELSVYPNPFTEGISVQLMNSDKIDNLSFEVYNCLGQLVRVFETSSTQYTFNINLSELAAGTYIIKVIDMNNGIPLLNKMITKWE